MIRLLTACLLVFALTACDPFALNKLQPGVSTGYEVRDALGTPDNEWKNVDGSVTWEFSRRPNARENIMIVIGSDNIMRSMTQVLTEENFARVNTGMSQDEVRRLLGKPLSVVKLDLKKQMVWDYPVATPFPDKDMRFNVHFDQTGKVAETSRHEVHKN